MKSTPTAGVLFWRAARQNGPRAWRCIHASKKYKYIYIARPGKVTRIGYQAGAMEGIPVNLDTDLQFKRILARISP